MKSQVIPTILKPVRWIGSTKDDLMMFPDRPRENVGHALYLAQIGKKWSYTKPLKGFGGASILEVVTHDDGNTFRAVYTIKFESAVYILHCFQKKSKSGKATPKQEIDLINHRLTMASEDYKRRKNHE